MKTGTSRRISYDPSKDEILLEFQPPRWEPNVEKGRFKLWWDTEGNICAIATTSFTKEIEEFRKRLNTIRLGGIWKGVEITEQDIRETREELLKKLEERW